MYLEHFGLKRQPFKITPDTSLFYKGNKRGAALEALKYSVISGEGIIKVVGEVGSGKTMLCRMLEIELPENVEVVYIANPSLSAENIVHAIAFELHLDVDSKASKLEVMQKVQKYLLDKHAKGKQVVVFVEEAQSMPLETLEEIRLLSNLETSQHKLLQMILFGQPELDEKLRDASIRQLKERITHSFYLDPFPSSDIYEYLNYRMRAVGYRGPDIFSKNIASNIEKKSKGLTRRINILADKALLAAYSEGRHGISGKDIKIAAKDSDFDQSREYKGMLWVLVGVLAIGLSFWLGTLLQGDQVKIVEKQEQQLPVNQVKIETQTITDMAMAVENENIIDGRVTITKEWLKQANSDDYTIQLILIDDDYDEQLTDYIEMAKQYLDIDQIYIYQAIIRERKMFSVLYNAYADWDIAVKQLQALPASMKISGPYLRTVKGIRADIRKSQDYIRTANENTGV